MQATRTEKEMRTLPSQRAALVKKRAILAAVTVLSLSVVGFIASAVRIIGVHPVNHATTPKDSGKILQSSLFAPTKVNAIDAPAIIPDGMAWIPGGEFSMGANDPPDMNEVGMNATEDARPIHRVYVDAFFMDKTDVTNS